MIKKEDNEEYNEHKTYNNNHVISSNNNFDFLSNNIEGSYDEIHTGSCISKTKNVNPLIDTYDYPNINNKYSFCCLCGKYDFEHNEQTHFFFAAFEEHRCITCNKWFFQHKGMKNPCWVPRRYIEL